MGREYAGHAESDCALFSFGPIKTATSLGGAVVRVRDDVLRTRMAELQQTYPVQSRLAYARRLAKYAGFCVLSKPRVYGLAVRALEWMGIDYDLALANAAHSFRASDFFTQIRRQPCVPLMRMLQRRIGTFDRRGASRLRRRTERGDELSRGLAAGMVVGEQNPTQTYWVVPVQVGNREAVLAALRGAGFDATLRSSLIVVANPNGLSAGDIRLAHWLANIVFMPCGEDVPDREWQRLISIVGQVAVAAELNSTRELAALSAVSSAS